VLLREANGEAVDVTVTPYIPQSEDDAAMVQTYHPYPDNNLPTSTNPLSSYLAEKPPEESQEDFQGEVIIGRGHGIVSTPTRDLPPEAPISSPPAQTQAVSSSQQNMLQTMDMDRLEALIDRRENKRIKQLAAPYGGQDGESTTSSPPPYPASQISHE